MPPISELLPDAEVLLDLEPEQLAGYLLEHLNSLPEPERARLNRYNFFLPGAGAARGYPAGRQGEILRALMEAWVWLEAEGLLAPQPGTHGEWQFITRRGRRLAGRVDFDAFRMSKLLPRGQLHPLIAGAAAGEFLIGRYDTAVFNAFREIEIAVRDAGGYTAMDFGKDLMQKAFNERTGQLRDDAAPISESQSLRELFAGTFGFYRNATGHRQVGIDPGDAAEIITLASLLMRIVDQRNPRNRP